MMACSVSIPQTHKHSRVCTAPFSLVHGSRGFRWGPWPSALTMQLVWQVPQVYQRRISLLIVGFCGGRCAGCISHFGFEGGGSASMPPLPMHACWCMGYV